MQNTIRSVAAALGNLSRSKASAFTPAELAEKGKVTTFYILHAITRGRIKATATAAGKATRYSISKVEAKAFLERRLQRLTRMNENAKAA